MPVQEEGIECSGIGGCLILGSLVLSCGFMPPLGARAEALLMSSLKEGFACGPLQDAREPLLSKWSQVTSRR